MLFTLMYCRILTPVKVKSCLWGRLKHIYDDDHIKPVTTALFSFCFPVRARLGGSKTNRRH